MDNGLMSIGKAAEMSHLSVATLRLYDELGLLKPKYKDPETGYRYYDIAQNARLDMIVYMKELGMSLTEIGDVLEKEDIVLIETILTQKNEQLHRQMRELRAQHDAVERAIASIERYRKSPETGTVVLEYILSNLTFAKYRPRHSACCSPFGESILSNSRDSPMLDKDSPCLTR